MKPLRTITLEEFPRRLKLTTEETDKRFAFFLGAGASVSSGIRAAGDLVKLDWLPRLRDVSAPHRKDLNIWAKEEFPDYNSEHPSAIYGPVIEKLFLYPEERQREIEHQCEGRFPSFGYAVLASLMALEGGRFSVALTTNFDDLIADALYLFSQARPLVIHHESLASYIRPTRTRPLIVKLHGDHRLSPHNTAIETETLKKSIEKQVRNLLNDRGLIFIGYGGNDKGIKKMLEDLPSEALPLGVFWASREEPGGLIRPWLESRGAVWVKKGDFDEVMLLVRDVFNLPHPDRKRFEEIFSKYTETYDTLSRRIISLSDTAPDAPVLKDAIKRTDESFSDEWAVITMARRQQKTAPEQAQTIYLKGLEQFPNSASLLMEYAKFLADMRMDYNKADKYFQRALVVDSNNPVHHANYARFLSDFRKDYDGAEKYYQRALAANPKRSITLRSYANFLWSIRKDYDKAEEYSQRALAADPSNSASLIYYANFLWNIRKDYDKAEEYFQRALTADPNNAGILGNYATFHHAQENFSKAEEYYRRALAENPALTVILGNYAGFLLANGRRQEGLKTLEEVLHSSDLPQQPTLEVECWFYALAHRSLEDQDEALRNLKRVLIAGARSPEWNFKPNIRQAKNEAKPDVPWLEKLAAVISEGADIRILDEWAKWPKN
ncbi:MAG: tetratricopeptide repeat protein [Pseudomonadota bacterium]